MGWWNQDEQGHSFAQAAREDMWWGDEPADLFAAALDDIVAAFMKELHREPTLNELRAGLEFCLRIKAVVAWHEAMEEKPI